MRHARKDYNRFQDPENKIGVDEPVFLLRAKDITAPETLRFWANTQRENPSPNEEIIKVVLDWADEMEKWQKENTSKYADL
jgi:hypothetical protein